VVRHCENDIDTRVWRRSTDDDSRIHIISPDFVCVSADIQMNVAARELDDKLELFTYLGSNWTLVSIDDCIVHIARYHP